MNNQVKPVLGIVIVALALGVLGDALLAIGPWGFNALLWTALLVGGGVWLAGRCQPPLARRAGALIVPILLAAAGFCWRDSEPLKLLDFGALALLLTWAGWRARGDRVVVGGCFDYAWRSLQTGVDTALGYLPLLVGRSPWAVPEASGRAKTARSAAIGVLVALPVLVVFGALFMAADAVFERFVTQVVNVDLTKLVPHLARTGFCAWVVAGYLQGVLLRERSWETPLDTARGPRLGPVEVGVALGLVNLLFLTFIVVQVRYLFGGANLVEVTPGLTYAT